MVHRPVSPRYTVLYPVYRFLSKGSRSKKNQGIIESINVEIVFPKKRIDVEKPNGSTLILSIEQEPTVAAACLPEWIPFYSAYHSS